MMYTAADKFCFSVKVVPMVIHCRGSRMKYLNVFAINIPTKNLRQPCYLKEIGWTTKSVSYKGLNCEHSTYLNCDVLLTSVHIYYCIIDLIAFGFGVYFSIFQRNVLACRLIFVPSACHNLEPQV